MEFFGTRYRTNLSGIHEVLCRAVNPERTSKALMHGASTKTSVSGDLDGNERQTGLW
jgi:hypothetical protein